MKKDFKFLLLTDPHFFKNSLGAYGKGYEEFMESEQKCFGETEAINRSVIEYLKEFKETDTILIAGDLSFNGEKESHEEYSRLLGELQATGKKIFVVTAGHDVSPEPFCFPGSDRKMPAEGIKFNELLNYYHEFGYDNAIAFNQEHMSYVAQLEDGIRLLVLCNDTATGRGQAYSDEFLRWIKQQVVKAKEDGQMIFAMEHYPVLPGQPILSLIDDATQKESQKLIDILADNGCNLCFTGHMHNQSINLVTTEKGNKFFDVCTGSLIGCPAFMRLCTIKDETTVEIKSIPVPEYEWDTKGKTCEEYLQAQFDAMIINLIKGMKDDPVKTMKKVHIKENKLLEVVFRKLGAAVCTHTLGEFAKLFAVKAEPKAEGIVLLDLFTDIIRNTFCGNQPYTEDTPEGKTLLNIFKKLSPLFRLLNKKVHDSQGNSVDIYEMLKHTLGNYGIDDHNATISLK